MAAQAEACAPIEDAVWKDGVSDEPIDPAVADAISSFPPAAGGTAFIVARGINVPVRDACTWRRLWQHANDNFGRWCAMQAITEDISVMKEYFGPTAPLLDFVEQRIDWGKWFECSLESRVNDTPNITEIFNAQIAFENQIGYDFVSCPFLFPSRAVVLDLVGGEPQEVTAVANRKIGKHAKAGAYRAFLDEEEIEKKRAEVAAAEETLTELRRLDEAWEGTTSAAEIVNDLVEDAANSYVTGEYDAMKVYEGHRQRIKKWADAQAEGYAKGLSGKRSHANAVSRLALGTMVSSEAVIMKEIASRTSRNREAPRPLSESRMKELRAGSHYRP